jgi:hypothetical protein
MMLQNARELWASAHLHELPTFIDMTIPKPAAL